MKIPQFLRRYLTDRCERIISSREPDVIIGGADDPYLLRWYAIPRNRFLNIYVHGMWRSDDDRALHDHPWWWCSIILRSQYFEQRVMAGGVSDLRLYRSGSIRFHRAGYAHRLIMPHPVYLYGKPLTLFITGPKFREWGFHCASGWRHWRVFTDPATNGATVGRGCE